MQNIVIYLLAGLLLVEVLSIYLKKIKYIRSFPTAEYIKEILTEGKDIFKNIEKLIEIIDGSMDIIRSKHLDIYFIKEKILTIRQISCIINAIDAAKEHRAENVRREILDIIEKRTGKLSVTEIYMFHIVLCIWK